MDINKDNVKIYATGLGYIIGEKEYDNGRIKLKYPFKLVPGMQPGEVSVAPLFMKEEKYVILHHVIAEISMEDAFLNLYEKYVNKFHNIIIQPDNSIIL